MVTGPKLMTEVVKHYQFDYQELDHTLYMDYQPDVTHLYSLHSPPDFIKKRVT